VGKEEEIDDKTSWQKKIENRIDQLNKKQKLEIENGLRQPDTSRHPAEVFLTGTALISFGMGLQSKAFTGLYLIGLILSLVDLPRVLGKDQSTFSKLLGAHTLYYIAGGVAASIYFTAIGHPFPGIELGLLADAANTVLQLVIS